MGKPDNLLVTFTADGQKKRLSEDSIRVESFTIQCHETNAGKVHIGGANVTADNGPYRKAGEPYNWNGGHQREGENKTTDLRDWYVLGESSGDKIAILFERFE